MFAIAVRESNYTTEIGMLLRAVKFTSEGTKISDVAISFVIVFFELFSTLQEVNN